MTDQELLGRFRADRDEEAFRSLVRRHGSMVFDVCRNVLGNEADADDAFQATFLVLAQKAARIRKEASVCSWLFGVAYRIAVTEQRNSARRRKNHSCRSDRRAGQAADEFTWREVQQVLYEELNKISKCYRTPLVLYYLEGKTQDEAAAQLGVSKATVKQRLERGRALLRVRLVRRGLGPVTVLLAASWPLATATANPGPLLVASTVKAAALISVPRMVAAGLVSTKVAALIETVVKAALVTKVETTAMLVLAALLAVSGTGLITYRSPAVATYAEASLARVRRAEEAPERRREHLEAPTIRRAEEVPEERRAEERIEAPMLRRAKEAPEQRRAEEYLEAPTIRRAEEAPEQWRAEDVDRRASLEAGADSPVRPTASNK
jgi:RNA polymerase sigma factor (sigma-70 family)